MLICPCMQTSEPGSPNIVLLNPPPPPPHQILPYASQAALLLQKSALKATVSGATTPGAEHCTPGTPGASPSLGHGAHSPHQPDPTDSPPLLASSLPPPCPLPPKAHRGGSRKAAAAQRLALAKPKSMVPEDASPLVTPTAKTPAASPSPTASPPPIVSSAYSAPRSSSRVIRAPVRLVTTS